MVRCTPSFFWFRFRDRVGASTNSPGVVCSGGAGRPAVTVGGFEDADGGMSSPPSAASTKRRGKVGRRLMVRTHTDILREQARSALYW